MSAARRVRILGLSAFGRDSAAFCRDVLAEAGVAITPGIDFGAHGTESTIRFAYTRSMSDLEEAVRRIGSFAA